MDEFERMRTYAFENDDFTSIERYAQSCKPAITALILGESNNIGVNVNFFFEKCNIDATAYDFFKIARDGFYTGNSDFCKIGVSEFPKWMEGTESSYQGIVNKKVVKEYLKKWKSIRKTQQGFFKVISDQTIQCLKSELE